MRIFIGADHRGFQLKQSLIPWLTSLGHEIVDCGNTALDGDDDYVIYAQEVARRVVAEPESRGIAICGSGVGVTIASNRTRGVRCGLAMSPEQVEHARTHDHINILALASEYMTEDVMHSCIETFLTAQPIMSERYLHRNLMLDEEI